MIKKIKYYIVIPGNAVSPMYNYLSKHIQPNNQLLNLKKKDLLQGKYNISEMKNIELISSSMPINIAQKKLNIFNDFHTIIVLSDPIQYTIKKIYRLKELSLKNNKENSLLLNPLVFSSYLC